MKEYRLEPIVTLTSQETVGYELLAGEKQCPQWDDAQWREWYAYLAWEIPILLSSLHPGDSLLFLNLDGDQILDNQINSSIRSLRDHASRIVLEWTEHRFHDDRLIDIITRFNFLKGIGFLVAIDDIGAGFGVDGLGRAGAIKSRFCKIDGPYFQEVREKGPEYLQGLCNHLAHGGAEVIVEWVETEDDYRLALASGARLGQGWYFR